MNWDEFWDLFGSEKKTNRNSSKGGQKSGANQVARGQVAKGPSVPGPVKAQPVKGQSVKGLPVRSQSVKGQSVKGQLPQVQSSVAKAQSPVSKPQRNSTDRRVNQMPSKSHQSSRRLTRVTAVGSGFHPMLVSNIQFGSRLSAHNKAPQGMDLYDVSCYIIECHKHRKMIISLEEKTNYVWLPFVSLDSNVCWEDSAIDGLNTILANGDPQKFVSLASNPVFVEFYCLQLFRLQLPQTQKFNVRLIYYVKLNAEYKCCSDTKRLKWTPIDDVVSRKNPLYWGPELADFTRLATGFGCKLEFLIHEYSLDEAFRYVPRDPPRNLEEDMLKSTGFTEKDVERLFTDFVEHCFPAFFMTKTSFNDYMSKYGFEKMDKKLELLFRAFNYKNTGFLSFHEFLIGLTSIDPSASNGQSRIKFLFKYFDADSDGFLNEREFTAMVKEIHQKDDINGVEKKVAFFMKQMKAKKEGIHFDDFFRAVGAHQFRGTSGLCRSNAPILQQISQSMASRTLKGIHIRSNLGSILKDKKYKGVCLSCKDKKYEYATHVVKLDKEGFFVEATPLEAPNGSENNATEPPKPIEPENAKKKSTESLGLTGLTREQYSAEVVWNVESVAHYLIKQIQMFNKRKGTHKDNRGVMDGKEEREKFVHKVEKLCKYAEKIVAQEDRCVRVSAPAFVIGDIHGNLEDLMTLEKVLWKSIPIMSSNFVFLGDYVDRGKWGLECAIYILCLKMLAPNKVVVLRGNHEVRALQNHYTYHKECDQKYGSSLGTKLWDLTNKVFDKLPICAIIDDAIFCAHGGIPASTRLVGKINEVKVELKDPEREASIAWEILWSDPISAQKFAETADLLQIRVESAKGFLTNTKRGTAFLFSEEAANNFLQNNGLTHIVRAHEVPAQGFTFHFGNKCTTIFSSSHYCGNDNQSACVHIDNEKLRIVRLDTKNNAPASD